MYDIVNTGINNHVPVWSVPTRIFPEWYDHDMVELVTKKLEAHKLYNQTHNSLDGIAFKNLSRSQVIRLSRVNIENIKLS